MALGDGHMLGGEQAASCMEYGVVSASTMACHAARHTLYCKKIDVTKEELAWNFGCISASQNNEQEAVLDEDINWDDAAEGIGEGIEGPEGFRDSDDDDEERGGDGGATRRRSEIANGPSREGDGGARGNNGDATDDANRGTDAGGDGEGDSDVEVDATVSRAPPKKGRTAMEVTEWRANGTMRKGRARRMEKETASRQRLLAISRHSPRTLATWEGFVNEDGLKNIRTKKRRREEPAEV
ncbi:hypothetical protein EMIHUDRAFT_242366 [Emiliania huxleyi CCMP1516]|uniref:Uncharacterized protein n=2 Tax=Emiliania huxleyi TaxID=2903 RepID=A0A0D3J9F8_EMIH1|nr:hypothetical protein EMIHUDRAFT_242366 [Emiliania huxleyi CCMP1516]EOD20143.1 hypothetical protein EMIHUDRAFT_242366 [Emiliania huxleyi CCMP1516]|eukprot:XP_005772572.1 hypothetical protein EMIHUDRAFT_242366 [Emiliania huxleyi CCMP1516]